jgi:hypothetical protein
VNGSEHSSRDAHKRRALAILGGVDTSPPPLPSITGPAPGVSPLYHEEQHFRQWWLWVLVIFPAGLAWWPFIEQIIGGRPVGQNPAPNWLVLVIWVFIGIGLPFLFGYTGLVIDVTPDSVRVHYRPFVRRRIPLSDIQRLEARRYSPVKEYGGWGIKGWSKANMAYNVSGDRGVELTLVDGRAIMLGSQRADELAAAISAQKGAHRGGERDS